jgi:hypothetical protein
MLFTQVLAVLAFAPFLAVASPVAIEDMSMVQRSTLERRGGIDFCGSDLRAAGDSCTFGSTEKDPHACGIKNRAAVVSLSKIQLGELRLTKGKLECRKGKWVLKGECGAGQQCMCNKGNPARGDLVCR